MNDTSPDEKLLQELHAVLTKNTKQIEAIDSTIQCLKDRLNTKNELTDLRTRVAILESALTRISMSEFATMESIKKFAQQTVYISQTKVVTK